MWLTLLWLRYQKFKVILYFLWSGSLFLFLTVCVYVCVFSKDRNLWESFFVCFIHHVGPGDGTQSISLGSKVPLPNKPSCQSIFTYMCLCAFLDRVSVFSRAGLELAILLPQVPSAGTAGMHHHASLKHTQSWQIEAAFIYMQIQIYNVSLFILRCSKHFLNYSQNNIFKD